MKHPIRAALAAVALVVGGLGATLAAPAVADHSLTANLGSNYFGHWYRYSNPGVSTNVSGWDTNIQDAAYFWQDGGAPATGYTPNVPSSTIGAVGCDENQHSGWISVCMVGTSDSRLHGHPGRTQAYWNPADNHLSGANVYIDNSLTGAYRQNIMRHEFGHAMGLGHQGGNGGNGDCDPPPSGYTDSVMRCDPLTPYLNYHDQDAIWGWYYWHQHP